MQKRLVLVFLLLASPIHQAACVDFETGMKGASLFASAGKLILGLYEDKLEYSSIAESPPDTSTLRKLTNIRMAKDIFRIGQQVPTTDLSPHYITALLLSIIRPFTVIDEESVIAAFEKEYGENVPIEVLKNFYGLRTVNNKQNAFTGSILRSCARLVSFGLDVTTFFLKEEEALSRVFRACRYVCDYFADSSFSDLTFSLPKNWDSDAYNDIQQHIKIEIGPDYDRKEIKLSEASPEIKQNYMFNAKILSNIKLAELFTEALFLAFYVGREQNTIYTPCCNTKLCKSCVKNLSVTQKNTGIHTFVCPCCKTRTSGKVEIEIEHQINRTIKHVKTYHGMSRTLEATKIAYGIDPNGQKRVKELSKQFVDGILTGMAEKLVPGLKVLGINEQGHKPSILETERNKDAREKKSSEFIKKLYG